MVDLCLTLIKNKELTIEEVPLLWRKQVKKQLEQQEA